MAINHIGTMATGGYDGTMAVCGYDGTNTMMSSGCDTSDNYDGSSMKGDGYDRSSAMMADGYNGSSAMATMVDGFNGSNATMGDGYDGSNSLAICNRGSPSPPPFLSPPTQTAVESGRSELEEKTFQNNLRQVN